MTDPNEVALDPEDLDGAMEDDEPVTPAAEDDEADEGHVEPEDVEG